MSSRMDRRGSAERERCIMNWSNDCRTRLLSVALAVLVAIGGASAKADFTFGEPVNLGPTINSPSGGCWVCISSDGLELYYGSARLGSLGSIDIWVARRASVSDSCQTPTNPGPPLNNSGGRNFPCCLSVDGLELYIVSCNRSGGYGGYDLWVARRETEDDDWQQPTNRKE